MNKTFICMLIAWCTCLTGMAQNHFEKYFEKKNASGKNRRQKPYFSL